MERDSKELCLVLKSVDKGDSSRLLTLFSRQRGAFTALLYGARKSRKGLKVPLFSEADFSLYSVEERHQCSIKDADFISIRENIFSDYDILIAASLVSELVTTSRMDGEEIYLLTARTLDELELGSDYKRVLIYFIINFLSLFGNLATLDYCPVCLKPYSSGAVLGYNMKEGTLCCSSCDDNGGTLILPENARLYLKRNLEIGITQALGLNISQMMVDRILSYLVRLLRLCYPSRLTVIESGMFKIG